MKHLLALAVCLMMSGTMAVSADDLSWLQEDTEQMEATESLPSNMITFDFSNVRDPNEDLKITVTGSNVSSRKLKVYGIVKNISAEDYEDISFEASFLDKYDEEIKRNIFEIDSIPAGETVEEAAERRLTSKQRLNGMTGFINAELMFCLRKAKNLLMKNPSWKNLIKVVQWMKQAGSKRVPYILRRFIRHLTESCLLHLSIIPQHLTGLNMTI